MRTFLLVALLMSLHGCAAHRPSCRDDAEDRREAHIRSHPDLDPVLATNMRQGVVSIGMTEEQVIATWGKPESVSAHRSGGKGLDYPKRGAIVVLEGGAVTKLALYGGLR
jgi:hypothetical protein